MFKRKDKQKGAETRKVYILGKKQVGHFKVTFLYEMARVYQADYLTKADQMIPG